MISAGKISDRFASALVVAGAAGDASKLQQLIETPPGVSARQAALSALEWATFTAALAKAGISKPSLLAYVKWRNQEL